MSTYETVTEMYSALGSDSPMRLLDEWGLVVIEKSCEVEFTEDLIEYMGTSDYELPAEIEPDEKYFEYVNEAIKQAQEWGWTVERLVVKGDYGLSPEQSLTEQNDILEQILNDTAARRAQGVTVFPTTEEN